MTTKEYNKNTLEAVTQGQVDGEPARSLYPLRLAKTTIFVILICINNSFCNNLADEAEVKSIREKEEAKDVALNRAEIREGKYWVNGGWVIRKNSQYERVAGGWIYKETNAVKENKPSPARTAQDIVDSDNDGYDDYTEYRNGTDPKDPRIFPAVKNGNNRVEFKMENCGNVGFKLPSLLNDNK